MFQYIKEEGIFKNQSTGQKLLYNFILQHPQVVVFPIGNDCLTLSIDSQVEPQLVPKLVLRVSVRELHTSMVIPPEEVGLKEERYSDNNIIISDSDLRNILPPQLKKMTYQYKFLCGCECCISTKIMNFPCSYCAIFI